VCARSIVEDLRRVLGRRCEDELARGGLAPIPDPTLKRPKLTIGEDAREFTLEALEELSADSIGLSLQLRTQGQTLANGSARVRQSRRGLGERRWVARTSPCCHAVAKPARKPSKLPS
jgi:hypothetical protein